MLLFKRKKARMVCAMRALWVVRRLSVYPKPFRVILVAKVVFVLLRPYFCGKAFCLSPKLLASSAVTLPVGTAQVFVAGLNFPPRFFNRAIA